MLTLIADSSCLIDLHKVALLVPLVFLPDRELRERLHRLHS